LDDHLLHITCDPLLVALSILFGVAAALTALAIGGRPARGLGRPGPGRDLMAVRQRAQEEARLRLAAIVASSSDAILSFDEVGRITSWNAAAERMFGWPAAEMLGRTGLELIPAEAMRERHDQLACALAGGLIVEREAVRRRRDGSRLDVAISMAPLRSADGRIVGASLIARDVGARKRAEAELVRANRRLLAADQQKDQFLSVIAHELRTPLNSITGFGSILQDEVAGPLNAQQQQYLGKIMEGSDMMLHLVTDLLDMAKIQAGKLTLEPGPADVEALVEGVVARLQPLAARRGLRLSATVDVPGRATLDAIRIGQVLTNLVGNAIKFTERGEVALSVVGRPGEALRFAVRDTGAGITEEDAERLFTPFQQVDPSATRRATGTGLGLSISKAIVEGHGGRIGVLSEPGQGSTFWFWLPAALPLVV